MNSDINYWHWFRDLQLSTGVFKVRAVERMCGIGQTTLQKALERKADSIEDAELLEPLYKAIVQETEAATAA